MPKTCNWHKYNKELVNRGKIDFWINIKALEQLPQNTKKGGHLFVYSDVLIQAMSYARFKFHLSLREAEGFFISLMGHLCLNKISCYTQLCRRFKRLKLPAKLLDRRKVTNIVLDTTGLKVYGEGEWRAEKYGGKKKWKKLHLALDLNTGKLILSELSEERVHDTAYMEKALKAGNRREGKILIDGIADSRKCYILAQKYNNRLLTPPKKRAVIRTEPELERRNDAIKMIRRLYGGSLGKRSGASWWAIAKD